nr:MAG TPA: hypothetical protein [Caudoviricetes sp.]
MHLIISSNFNCFLRNLFIARLFDCLLLELQCFLSIRHW